MSKVIIDNRIEDLSDIEALNLVGKVMDEGRISNDGKQYSYVTTFKNIISGKLVVIRASLNKQSDRFVLREENT